MVAVVRKQTESKHRLNWACKWSVYSNKSNLASGPHHPRLLSVLPAANERFWSITFSHKWSTLKQRTCACQSNVIPDTHNRHAGVIRTLLLDWPPGLSRTKIPSLSQKWQQLVAGAKRRGYFERARGQTEQEKGVRGERADLSEPQGPEVGGREGESQKVRDN